ALMFLVASFRSLRENEAALTSAFGIEAAPRQAPWWRRLFGVLDGVREADQSIDVARLWREYTDAGAWYISLFRAVIPALAFVILAGMLIAVFGVPHEPVRGLAMAQLNKVLMAAVLVAFLLTL